MADNSPIKTSYGLIVESWGPFALSVASVVTLLHFKSDLILQATANKFQPANLYSAVFTWSAIQVGFAFGVYGFILTKTDGFVGAVKRTVAMERFLRYVRRGTAGGFLLTIASIPVAAISPDFGSSDLCYDLLAAWFSLFVWTFFAFLRIGFNFGRLSIVPDQEPFYGA